jgi:hypothetical protein
MRWFANKVRESVRRIRRLPGNDFAKLLKSGAAEHRTQD